jgi:hypothetical protein
VLQPDNQRLSQGCKLTPNQIPERRTQSLYADIVTDFLTQGTPSMQITIEGMKPATLRAGLRRALKGNEDMKLAQRGEETYLARQAAKWPSRSVVWMKWRLSS